MSKMSQLHQKLTEETITALQLREEEWDELPEEVQSSLLMWWNEVRERRKVAFVNYNNPNTRRGSDMPVWLQVVLTIILLSACAYMGYMLYWPRN